jgi:hypothetical protein
MELRHLSVIVEGLDSLADIEREHPELGKKLLGFVKEVRDCCAQGYGRLSTALGAVRNLSDNPTPNELEVVRKQIDDAPNSVWFRDVAGICDRLAALASAFEPQLSNQISYTSPFGENWQDSTNTPGNPRYAAHYRITPLVTLLQRQERDLKDDIRGAVAEIQTKLGQGARTGDYEGARQYALKIQKEIDSSIDEIAKLTYQIQGNSSDGVAAIITPEKMAEQALQTPERVLILSMFFLVFVFALGAFAFSFLKFYQFVLVSGFALTAVIVVNALYLRTTGKLSEENFLKLMELALLKFFAPLTRRNADKKDADAPSGG